VKENMPKIIRRDEVQDLMKRGAQVVEVLPHKQYREVHIAGASNIPLQKLNREAMSRLNRDKPVVVYCYDYQ
jgi:rhodanese-related sulfurtransferase